VRKHTSPYASSGLLEATLEGGPADLPSELRTQLVQQDQEKVKVAHYGGHEHFERDESCTSPVVYRWTGRTRVAE